MSLSAIVHFFLLRTCLLLHGPPAVSIWWQAWKTCEVLCMIAIWKSNLKSAKSIHIIDYHSTIRLFAHGPSKWRIFICTFSAYICHILNCSLNPTALVTGATPMNSDESDVTVVCTTPVNDWHYNTDDYHSCVDSDHDGSNDADVEYDLICILWCAIYIRSII